jgi:SNF2 family DNA or RNA helicase
MEAADYIPRTAFFAHQARAFIASRGKFNFALFMDPGTGKSKVIIDTAAYLYRREVINGFIILAPDSVDAQWLEQEIPKHLPHNIRTRMAGWDSHSTRAKRLCTELAKRPVAHTLAVLAMNHEALATKSGRAVLKQFLSTYRTLFCIDEAHAIKTPKAMRTRWAIILGRLAKVRRILTGTPITKTPFDLFAQFRFLDERIIGYDSFLAFKHQYGDWTKEYVQRFDPRQHKMVLQEYETLAGFKNLEQLYARIDRYIFRQRKEECLDLPPKMYSIMPVPLSAAQAALYEQIKDGGVLLLEKAARGEEITAVDLAALSATDDVETELLERLQDPKMRLTAQIKLVTLTRCRQVVGGFLITDDRETLCIDGTPAKCPRLRAALAWLDGALQGEGKIIIWARFRAEMQALHLLIAQADIDAVLINSGTTQAARRSAIARFKDRADPLRVMITHEQSMGVGMDFNMCSSMLFYSCSHSYYQRAQAEDRAHRIGQRGTVSITDLHAAEVEIDRTMAAARRAAQGFKDDFMQWTVNDLRTRL